MRFALILAALLGIVSRQHINNSGQIVGFSNTPAISGSAYASFWNSYESSVLPKRWDMRRSLFRDHKPHPGSTVPLGQHAKLILF